MGNLELPCHGEPVTRTLCFSLSICGSHNPLKKKCFTQDLGRWLNERYLMQKHEGLNLDSPAPCKSWVWWHAPVTPALGNWGCNRQTGQFLELDKMESCRFPERPYLKNKVKSDTVRHLALTSDPHIHVQTETNRQMHARTHAYVHTQRSSFY